MEEDLPNAKHTKEKKNAFFKVRCSKAFYLRINFRRSTKSTILTKHFFAIYTQDIVYQFPSTTCRRYHSQSIRELIQATGETATPYHKLQCSINQQF